MKTLLLIAATVFTSVGMTANLPQCDATSTSKVNYESDTMRVTYTTGEIARQTYESLNVAEEAPKPGTFPEDYVQKALILAKYTESATCWKIQPPSYTHGQYTGVADCQNFSCNLIEKFKK